MNHRNPLWLAGLLALAITTSTSAQETETQATYGPAEAQATAPVEDAPAAEAPPKLSWRERSKIRMRIFHCRHPDVRKEAQQSGHPNMRGVYGNGTWKPAASDFNRGDAKPKGMDEECKALIAKWDRVVNPHRYEDQ